jgi:hypothetical protein
VTNTVYTIKYISKFFSPSSELAISVSLIKAEGSMKLIIAPNGSAILPIEVAKALYII